MLTFYQTLLSHTTLFRFSPWWVMSFQSFANLHLLSAAVAAHPLLTDAFICKWSALLLFFSQSDSILILDISLMIRSSHEQQHQRACLRVSSRLTEATTTSNRPADRDAKAASHFFFFFFFSRRRRDKVVLVLVLVVCRWNCWRQSRRLGDKTCACLRLPSPVYRLLCFTVKRRQREGESLNHFRVVMVRRC